MNTYYRYSYFSLPGIRAVKTEHKTWRIEKGTWFAVQMMVLVGSVLLLTGLNPTP